MGDPDLEKPSRDQIFKQAFLTGGVYFELAKTVGEWRLAVLASKEGEEFPLSQG